MKPIADDKMIREAMGPNDDYETHPPLTVAPTDHPLWPQIVTNLREVYDPEIPVNIYELGLIYTVDIDDQNNVDVKMSLTAPGCPVAGEMPGMVERAITPVPGVGIVRVELIWEPAWDKERMAETAKLVLNMF